MITAPYYKKSILLLSVLLIISCQPPTANIEQPTTANQSAPQSSVTIDDNTVTMAPEHILSVKPSRYQPSLGLQGTVVPVKRVNIKAAQSLIIQQVLIQEGQWVEKGSDLFIVQTQAFAPTYKVANNNTANTAKIAKASTELSERTVSSSNAAIEDKSANKTVDEISIANTAGENSRKSNAANQTIANTTQLIVIKAPFSGRVGQLTLKAADQIKAGTSLLNLGDDTDLHFIATLPIQAEPQLSVGQTVNFTTRHLSDKFTGQVSKLIVDSKFNKLLVYVHVIENEIHRDKLRDGMVVTGQVDYGQIAIGTIVPKSAIHDVDLSALNKPPYRPLKTLSATVWIIQQDQRLTRQPVEVIEYDPSTDRYLIAGVNNDSLICLAKLPLESAGKKVIIS